MFNHRLDAASVSVTLALEPGRIKEYQQQPLSIGSSCSSRENSASTCTLIQEVGQKAAHDSLVGDDEDIALTFQLHDDRLQPLHQVLPRKSSVLITHLLSPYREARVTPNLPQEIELALSVPAKTRSYSVTQAGLQWHNHSSLQPRLPRLSMESDPTLKAFCSAKFKIISLLSRVVLVASNTCEKSTQTFLHKKRLLITLLTGAGSSRPILLQRRGKVAGTNVQRIENLRFIE
ncbi:hypothetical protein AAY473_021174 [Plecturocebus cupreus]